MAIRCIRATQVFCWNILYKSITYETILIFLLRIEFWVGRNEQSKGLAHKAGTSGSLRVAERAHLGGLQLLQ